MYFTLQNVGFEVLTPVTLKISVFWDVMLCSLVKVTVLEEHTASIFRILEPG
jgi:hypothetical protein